MKNHENIYENVSNAYDSLQMSHLKVKTLEDSSEDYLKKIPVQ